MLRLIFTVIMILLLLCSCTIRDPYKEAERNARIDALTAERKKQLQLWEDTFEQLPGTQVSELVDLWGEPEKPKSNEYLWSAYNTSRGGGYYVTDGTTRQTLRDKDGYTTGYIDTPRERYVEPYQEEILKCTIKVTVDRKGRVTQADYKSPDINPSTSCSIYFPFHKK